MQHRDFIAKAAPTLDYPSLLSKNRPAVIHTRAEHKHYLAELERMFHKPSLTSAEQRYCELLGVLIEDYEKRAFPFEVQGRAG